MSTTYYRYHLGSRDPQEILDPAHQRSIVWVGCVERKCTACDGSGEGERYHYVDGDGETIDEVDPCETCRGRGIEQITEQRGVSACESIDELNAYFAERAGDTEGDWLICFEGELADEEDVDAESGAVLTIPTRIISIERA